MTLKRIYKIFFLLYAVSTTYSQVDSVRRFPNQNINSNNNESLILTTEDDTLIFFWRENNNFLHSFSADGGDTWNGRSRITGGTNGLYGLRTSSGRIIIGYYQNWDHPYYRYSDDNAETWSQNLPLPLENYVDLMDFFEVQNNLWCVYRLGHVYYRVSTDNGSTWGSETIQLWPEFDRYIVDFDIVNLNDTTLFAVILASGSDDQVGFDLYGKISRDNGISWETDKPIIQTGDFSKTGISAVSDKNEVITIVYTKSPSMTIESISSTDAGQTWSAPNSFTRYIGDNYANSAEIYNEKIYVSLSSDRSGKEQIWYGILNESYDIFAPPIITRIEPDWSSSERIADTPIPLRVHAIDEGEIEKAYAVIELNGRERDTVELFDDGLHEDYENNDNIFGNVIDGYDAGDTLRIRYTVTDDRQLSDAEEGRAIYFYDPSQIDNYLIDVNNMLLPISRNGILADVLVPHSDNTLKAELIFEESAIIYSSGFGLSGLNNGKIWSNGVLSVGRIEDYQAGKVGTDPDNPLNRIYVVRSSDIPFSESWLDWGNAVELGADFYDGNEDGIYNPSDINRNGLWDENEDRPDLLGDITAWCVFNDGKPGNERNFIDADPMGIEIKQTVFAYDKSTTPELANVIFVRYKIENSGSVSDNFDSVYFGAWVDSDLGEYPDDLGGTDTLLNSLFNYNDGVDNKYGTNPPAVFVSQLQGPFSYTASKSYDDINNNNTYDAGIDIPIDSARIFKGPVLGIDYLQGAENLDLVSSIFHYASYPTLGMPFDEEQLRNVMTGFDPFGELINPCDIQFGEVFGEDCSSVNPNFMYSGDPVRQKGWLNSAPDDHRQIISSGPFNLAAGKPVEVIYAYTAGRGTDALNSVAVARESVEDVIRFYETNFSDITVRIKIPGQEQFPTRFNLSQNYPNPFNPETIIEYSIPTVERNSVSLKGHERFIESLYNTELKIFDVLGREVATLVNKPQQPGNYKVHFNAGSLASGVYFYTLKYGSLIQSKKMMMLK